MRWRRRPIRLARELAAHDAAEAAIADRDAAFGNAGCGCFWEYLPGGHIRIWTCDSHAFICTPDGEA
jgi:hypothetical protein